MENSPFIDDVPAINLHLWLGYSMAMLNFREKTHQIPLNPIKPSFSYGFPMVNFRKNPIQITATSTT